MSNINNGGPAFPVPYRFVRAGMTLRDYFAANALSAYMDGSDAPNDFLMIARRSYAMADAMLAARASKCPERITSEEYEEEIEALKAELRELRERLE